MDDKITLVCDTECYRNYWLISFRRVDNGKTLSFEKYDGHPLDVKTVRDIMQRYRIVTFNGTSYDLPMIAYALTGASNSSLKDASDQIIDEELKPWQSERIFGITIPRLWDHIDISEVAPGVMISLKLYGGRLHSRTLQDLPIEHDALIWEAERAIIRPYCENDLQTTIDLWLELLPQMKLRFSMSKEYRQDLRSKSDAQIAETVIRTQVSELLDRKIDRPFVAPGTSFKYQTPAFLSYLTQEMPDVMAMVQRADFVVSASGSVQMPKELSDAKIKIGDGVYRMGIGGLHSSEQVAAHFADEDTILVDRDVASYYPWIILILGLFPPHMGQAFLTVYRRIVERRLAAKAAKDKVTAESLKITINGSFGKLGSKWSALYSPNLMIQVTMTGQLSLLMLIKALHVAGIPVVSANTDGIVIKCPKRLVSRMDEIVAWWEGVTKFETEATFYKAIYSRDVNNYIAVKVDEVKDGVVTPGEVKLKGEYAEAGVKKNPANSICVEAITNLLTKGILPAQTIVDCRDIRKFVTVRTVNGGAVKDDQFLGRVVRWYYSTETTGEINYKKNGNKVPRSDNARPLMTLPDEIPADLDYAWYIDETHSMLRDLAVLPA